MELRDPCGAVLDLLQLCSPRRRCGHRGCLGSQISPWMLNPLPVSGTRDAGVSRELPLWLCIQLHPQSSSAL